MQKNNQVKNHFTGVPFQSINLESGHKHAAAAARDIMSITEQQFGESSTELKDLVNHHGHGFWRC